MKRKELPLGTIFKYPNEDEFRYVAELGISAYHIIELPAHLQSIFPGENHARASTPGTASTNALNLEVIVYDREPTENQWGEVSY